METTYHIQFQLFLYKETSNLLPLIRRDFVARSIQIARFQGTIPPMGVSNLGIHSNANFEWSWERPLQGEHLYKRRLSTTWTDLQTTYTSIFYCYYCCKSIRAKKVDTAIKKVYDVVAAKLASFELVCAEGDIFFNCALRGGREKIASWWGW